MVALAREKYPDRPIEKGLDWFLWCLQEPSRLVLVGPNSFGIAHTDMIYGFEPKAGVDVLACRPGSGWEALRMVRVMLAWAKARGARGSMKLDADTGVDFGPFARRLGGGPSQIRWYDIPI